MTAPPSRFRSRVDGAKRVLPGRAFLVRREIPVVRSGSGRQRQHSWQTRGHEFESRQLHGERSVETSAIAGVSARLGWCGQPFRCVRLAAFLAAFLVETQNRAACRVTTAASGADRESKLNAQVTCEY
jgi:hypothetical protein